jgi:hypothetical protein
MKVSLDNAVDTSGSPLEAPSTDPSEPAAAFRAAGWKAVARRYQVTLAVAALLGVLSVGLGLAAGAPLGGAFGAIGLGLGAYNGRRLWTDTTSLKGEVTDARKSMAASSLRRLGLVTMLAFLIALLYRQQGWAVFVGLMAFQLLMVGLLIRPLRTVVRGL